MLRSYLFLPSCLPYSNHSVRLVNALTGSANPLGLPFTKASNYLRLFRTGPQDHVWTPQDFIDLGSRAAVDKALSRNCKSGLINRAGRSSWSGAFSVYATYDALVANFGSRAPFMAL